MREDDLIEAVRQQCPAARRAARAAFTVVRLPAPRAGRPRAGTLRLRFDRVVLTTARRLRTELAASVPSQATAVVTLSAPIRVAARTAAMIIARARPVLVARSRRVLRESIHGNAARVALMAGAGTDPARLACFVHNADSDVAFLLACCRRLLANAAAAPATRSPRWLVLVVPVPGLERVLLEIVAELGLGRECRRIVLIGAQDRVIEARAPRRRG